MSDNIKNNIHELSQEEWERAAQSIIQVSGFIATYLKQVNRDGRGDDDAEDFITDIQLAVLAMRYVARYARDKCVIVTVPNDEVYGTRKSGIVGTEGSET
ncbi:MAG: hypothetical protein LBS24_00635 [Clostridiales Family XIII bacterium]|jgi:hypothetical protein|nr:hypothetical protein [Clostridiales Family XIII bacterium]